LGKCGYDAVEIAGELEDHANPAVWASAPEQSLSPWHWVGFSIVGVFHRQHDILKRLGEVEMLCPDMKPSVPSEFNVAPILASDKKYHMR
jgi:hypothetical protein